jgi:hypothetical protein
MLDPLPIPFNLLQHVRPFIWEAPNAAAFVASIEYSIWALVFVGLLCKIHKPALHIKFILKNKLLSLLFWWSVLHVIIFSFSSNLGDLSRRHIYYYPFILLLSSPIKIRRND